MRLKRPTESTLRKYGLSVGDWNLIAFRQGERCALCKGLPPSGRLAIDHEHVRGFKRMPPDEKRKHVRGLLCQLPCNRYLLAKNTSATLDGVREYLAAHEGRKRK